MKFVDDDDDDDDDLVKYCRLREYQLHSHVKLGLHDWWYSQCHSCQLQWCEFWWEMSDKLTTWEIWAEIWAQSVYADAWRPALAGYSPASAVQAGWDSPSLSSAPSSRLPRRLLCASLWSSWSPASAICQTSSTVSSTSSTRHLWDPCFFCSQPNSLEFTARLSVDSEQFRQDLKTYLFAGHSRR